MKKINVLIKSVGVLYLLFMMFLAPGCASSQTNMDSGADRAYNVEDLNSYGEWVNVNEYGRVWRPFAVNNWMPFDNGHWSYADANWTWVSYEPFGWIVYHYGYWFDDPIYGWVWIPSDGLWSPANVSWLYYGDYIGWAPLGPRGIVYGRPWEMNQNRYWHVVRASDFTRDNIRDFRVTNPVRNDTGNEIFERQPDRQFVERSVGKTVTEINLNRESAKLPERNIEKMNLPKEENKRVEQNSSRVKKEVLMPREEFHRQQKARNQNGGRKK